MLIAWQRGVACTASRRGLLTVLSSKNAAPSGSIPDALRHLRRAQQGVMTGVDRVGTASKASDHSYCSTTVCMIGKGKPVEEHKRQNLSIAIERSVADGLLDGSYLELVRCSGARVRVF